MRHENAEIVQRTRGSEGALQQSDLCVVHGHLVAKSRCCPAAHLLLQLAVCSMCFAASVQLACVEFRTAAVYSASLQPAPLQALLSVMMSGFLQWVDHGQMRGCGTTGNNGMLCCGVAMLSTCSCPLPRGALLRFIRISINIVQATNGLQPVLSACPLT